MRPLGIRSRLTLSYTALFLLVLALLGAALMRAMATQLERATDQRLNHLCTGLWGYFEFQQGRPVLAYSPEDHAILDFLRTAARYYQLYDADHGNLLLQSEDSALLHLALPPEEVMRVAQQPGYDETSQYGRLRFRSMDFRNGSEGRYLLRVGLPLTDVQTAVREFSRVLLLLLPAGVIVAALIGWYMSDRALKPVHELQLAAHDISISNLNRRLPTRGTGDELDSLANTFNQVFSRLEESVRKMQQFTASISHELRTPLACLQGEAELALRDDRIAADPSRHVFASQLEEFQKLRKLIDRLTILARAEAGDIRLTAEPFDMSALLVSVVEQINVIAESREISLTVNAERPVWIIGDAHWFQRAVLNLIDNALKFTPAGGRVTVQSTTCDHVAVLEVHDTGIGIGPLDIPRIFDRFYRAGTSRSRQVEGIGLGLTIAKWIVEAHRGTIDVKSQVGFGTSFTVRLPLAPVLPPSAADGHLID